MTVGKQILLALHEVPSRGEREYEDWSSSVLKRVSACADGIKAIRFRAAAFPPGGVRNCEFEPQYLTIIESVSSRPLIDGTVTAEMRPPISHGRVVLQRAYYEFNPAQRSGPFLGEQGLRAIFLIVQDVPAEHESSYNYWFDVDDGKNYPQPQSHYKERLQFPGFLRATRMRAIEFAPNGSEAGAQLKSNYVTLFELSSEQALLGEEYTKSSQPKPGAVAVQRPYVLRVRHGYTEQFQSG